MVIKICKECNKEFKTPSTKRVFCSRKCLYKYNCKNQIGENNPSYKDIISKEELIELYVNKQRSISYIAKKYYCSRDLIINRLKKYDIKIRKFQEQIDINKKLGYSKEIYKGRPGKQNGSYVHGKYIGDKNNREEYLKIAKENKEWKCELCGKKETNNNFDLVVHHIDENNRNNNVKNLMILCQSCHTLWHSEHRNKKICKECGKEFKGFFTSKYCSIKCRNNYYKKHKNYRNKNV